MINIDILKQVILDNQHDVERQVVIPRSIALNEEMNYVLVGVRRADIIAGPIGMVIADSLLGEITPAMAAAIGSSDAYKILLPVNKCHNIVIGTGGKTTSELIGEAIEKIREICENC